MPIAELEGSESTSGSRYAMQKVLIADQDSMTQALYARLVTSLGHLPIICNDGIAVLDAVSSNPDVDLIITDIDLPGAWGEQVIEVIRGLDAYASVPILVISAPRTRTELMRLLVKGVRQWFKKPPSNEELLAAIENCLDRSAALDLFDVEEEVAVGPGSPVPSGSWLLEA